MYIGDIFHIHVHVSSIWVRQSHICGGATGSHLTGTDDTGNRVTGRRVTGRFLNRLYDLACSGAVYN